MSCAFLIGLLANVVMLHDLHLSKTEIRYNSVSDGIEITTHIFIDDLELAMGDNGKNLFLGTDKEVPEADSFINEYLSNHMLISSGSDTLKWHFLGKEISDDLMAFWCYMEIERPQLSKDLTTSISFFDDLYDDQKNVIDLKYDEKHKTYALLRRGKDKVSIKLP